MSIKVPGIQGTYQLRTIKNRKYYYRYWYDATTGKTLCKREDPPSGYLPIDESRSIDQVTKDLPKNSEIQSLQDDLKQAQNQIETYSTLASNQENTNIELNRQLIERIAELKALI